MVLIGEWLESYLSRGLGACHHSNTYRIALKSLGPHTVWSIEAAADEDTTCVNAVCKLKSRQALRNTGQITMSLSCVASYPLPYYHFRGSLAWIDTDHNTSTLTYLRASLPRKECLGAWYHRRDPRDNSGPAQR